MDDNTKLALEASINKWKRNLLAASPEEVRIHTDSCALCDIYYEMTPFSKCSGCPVAAKSGEAGCLGEWRATTRSLTVSLLTGAVFRESMESRILSTKNAFMVAAQKEIEFLESLRET